MSQIVEKLAMASIYSAFYNQMCIDYKEYITARNGSQSAAFHKLDDAKAARQKLIASGSADNYKIFYVKW